MRGRELKLRIEAEDVSGDLSPLMRGRELKHVCRLPKNLQTSVAPYAGA